MTAFLRVMDPFAMDKRLKLFAKSPPETVLTRRMLNDLAQKNDEALLTLAFDRYLFRNPERVQDVATVEALRQLLRTWRRQQGLKKPADMSLAPLPENTTLDALPAKYGSAFFKGESSLLCDPVASPQVGTALTERPWTGPDDCSFEVRGGWNKDRLLFCVTVKDDVQEDMTEGGSDPVGDALRLTVFVPNTKIAGKWIRHRLVAARKQDGSLFSSHVAATRLEENGHAKVAINRDKTEHTTTYEFEFLPSMLDPGCKEFSEDMVLQVNFQVQDNDGKGIKNEMSPRPFEKRDKDGNLYWQVHLKKTVVNEAPAPK